MLEVALRHRAEGASLGRDVADAHDLVGFERHGHDIGAVQVAREDAARNRVAVQPDKQVEQRCAIRNDDGLRAVFGDVHLFGEVERILDALLVAQARIGAQLVERDGSALRKRIAPADEDVRMRCEEFGEGEVGIAEDARDHIGVERAQIDDAQLAAGEPHIFDDIVRAPLAQRELVAFLAVFPDQVDEGVHDEGVVLRRYGEHAPLGRSALVQAFEHVGLLDHLAGIGQEPHAVLGERDAAARAGEDDDAHFGFQILDRLREGGLAYIEGLRRTIDRSAADDLDEVSKLVELHFVPSWSFGPGVCGVQHAAHAFAHSG